MAVVIDSGVPEATDPLDQWPQDRWALLLHKRRSFLKLNLNHDCRCLVRFVQDGERMAPALGYASVDDLITKGLELAPEEIRIAVAWLKLNEPEVPVAFEAVLAKHGGDRRSEIVKDQGGDATLKPEEKNTVKHILARLDRDGHHELAARVRSGELAANAAAIEIGWRRKLTPLQRIVKLLPLLSEEERQQLQEILAKK
jgi:hypothetical protein